MNLTKQEHSMPAKTVLMEADARARLMQGMDKLANAVRVTLGPLGRNVLLDQNGGIPRITKDGESVAEAIVLSDPCQNLGAQMLKVAANRVAAVAGDGTTTAVILAQEIAHGGMRAVAGGANPTDVRRGIDMATRSAIEALKSAARPINGTDEMALIGTIAANGEEEIGRQIAEAMTLIGPHGAIIVEANERVSTETEVVEGMQFECGYLSPYFVTDAEKMTVTLDDALVFLCDQKLTDLTPLVPLLEQVLKLDRPILLIATSVEGAALASLVMNQLQGNLRSAAIQAPGLGLNRRAMMEDLAVLTGGWLHDASLGDRFEDIDAATLGSVRRAIISRNFTTLIGGRGKPKDIAARLAQIEVEIELADQIVDTEALRLRAAKLSGGVALLKVGGLTEFEMLERCDRVKDALAATRAAMAEGVLPGGGVALLRSAASLNDLIPSNADQAAGIFALRAALEAPLKQIAANAGHEGSLIAHQIRASDNLVFGYDAQENRYGDMFDFGVLDAAKVVRIALLAAASVAGLIITAEAVIVDRR